MNRISPNKLLNSKWTSASPVKKEKHFIVIELVKPDESEQELNFQFIKIEAVYSNSVYQIEWEELKDRSKWKQGWV